MVDETLIANINSNAEAAYNLLTADITDTDTLEEKLRKITKNYKQCALKVHPDKVDPTQRDGAEKAFKKVVELYASLLAQPNTTWKDLQQKKEAETRLNQRVYNPDNTPLAEATYWAAEAKKSFESTKTALSAARLDVAKGQNGQPIVDASLDAARDISDTYRQQGKKLPQALHDYREALAQLAKLIRPSKVRSNELNTANAALGYQAKEASWQAIEAARMAENAQAIASAAEKVETTLWAVSADPVLKKHKLTCAFGAEHVHFAIKGCVTAAEMHAKNAQNAVDKIAGATKRAEQKGTNDTRSITFFSTYAANAFQTPTGKATTNVEVDFNGNKFSVSSAEHFVTQGESIAATARDNTKNKTLTKGQMLALLLASAKINDEGGFNLYVPNKVQPNKDGGEKWHHGLGFCGNPVVQGIFNDRPVHKEGLLWQQAIDRVNVHLPADNVQTNNADQLRHEMTYLYDLVYYDKLDIFAEIYRNFLGPLEKRMNRLNPYDKDDQKVRQNLCVILDENKNVIRQHIEEHLQEYYTTPGANNLFNKKNKAKTAAFRQTLHEKLLKLNWPQQAQQAQHDKLPNDAQANTISDEKNNQQSASPALTTSVIHNTSAAPVVRTKPTVTVNRAAQNRVNDALKELKPRHEIMFALKKGLLWLANVVTLGFVSWISQSATNTLEGRSKSASIMHNAGMRYAYNVKAQHKYEAATTHETDSNPSRSGSSSPTLNT